MESKEGKLKPSNLEVKPSSAVKEGTKLEIKIYSLAHEVPPSSNGMSKLRVPAHGTGVLELNKNISEEKRSLVKTNESEAENSTDVVALQSPLAPPLPKSPSESWLGEFPLAYSFFTITQREELSHQEGSEGFCSWYEVGDHSTKKPFQCENHSNIFKLTEHTQT
ncbi:OLC1v1028130C1 [Oldenlandia corymbosa var. corymbosa]|uniref:OLC1v1028130C1 n=1 Tax=Oldenlandia corymbosa var. corymbosa TaxID=529605 RepID=A0AAV1CBM5_OLDCO|nr:OLC1v1028130C1 [Oldenlandia corymbosa var. corymbosa]